MSVDTDLGMRTVSWKNPQNGEYEYGLVVHDPGGPVVFVDFGNHRTDEAMLPKGDKIERSEVEDVTDDHDLAAEWGYTEEEDDEDGED